MPRFYLFIYYGLLTLIQGLVNEQELLSYFIRNNWSVTYQKLCDGPSTAVWLRKVWAGCVAISIQIKGGIKSEVMPWNQGQEIHDGQCTYNITFEAHLCNHCCHGKGISIKYYECVHKNQNQLVAQYSFLFVVRSPTCFGQIYWPSSGSHVQQCFNIELSHVVTMVVVFTIIKSIKIGL